MSSGRFPWAQSWKQLASIYREAGRSAVGALLEAHADSEQLTERITELEATLALRARTLQDVNAALVAAMDRAEAAEERLAAQRLDSGE